LSDELLTAALVWDTRTLLESGAPDARLFYDAMSRSPLTTLNEVGEEPLARAGIALSNLLEGNSTASLETLDDMTSARPRLVRLLALSMLAWLFPLERPNSLRSGLDLARTHKDRVTRARFLTKFLGFALDAGDLELAQEAWRAAERSLDQNHPLAFQLRLVALNRRLGPVEVSDSALRPSKNSIHSSTTPGLGARSRRDRKRHYSIVLERRFKGRGARASRLDAPHSMTYSPRKCRLPGAAPFG
jgi:hypothetical protein